MVASHAGRRVHCSSLDPLACAAPLVSTSLAEGSVRGSPAAQVSGFDSQSCFQLFTQRLCVLPRQPLGPARVRLSVRHRSQEDRAASSASPSSICPHDKKAVPCGRPFCHAAAPSVRSLTPPFGLGACARIAIGSSAFPPRATPFGWGAGERECPAPAAAAQAAASTRRAEAEC